MFDYQAGEKYKLTLIMVAVAGMLAGVFFTVLLMPTPEAAPRRRQPPAWASNPDVTGAPMQTPEGMQAQAQGGQGAGLQGGPGGGPMATDRMEARSLIENFIPLAWDLSAASARYNQDKALSVMTDECKQAYTSNIWTPAIAQQIEQSDVRSTFTPKKIEPSETKSDGSVEVVVEGQQTLSVPNKGGKTRDVKVVYLVRKLPEGLRIAGISEAGQTQ